MAEFCKSCFKKLNPNLKDKKLILSKDTNMCEGCGDWKPVVVRVEDNNSLFKKIFRYRLLN